MAPEHRGATLFGPEMSYARLASLLSQGAEIRKTRITEEFDFDAYLSTSGRQVWPLFAIDSRDRIHIFTAEGKPEPRAGWHILGLVKEDVAKEEAKAEARAEAAAERTSSDKDKPKDAGDSKEKGLPG